MQRTGPLTIRSEQLREGARLRSGPEPPIVFALRSTLPIARGAAQTAGTLKAVGGYLGQRWPANVDWSVSWAAYPTWRTQTSEALCQRRPWSDASSWYRPSPTARLTWRRYDLFGSD